MNLMSSLYRLKVLDFGIEMLLIYVSFRMISIMLTLPMLRLLSSRAQGRKDLNEYPFARVSIIFHVFVSFCNGRQNSRQQHKG